MMLDIKRNSETVTIEFVGILDKITAASVNKILSCDILGAKELVFDMKGVESVSEAGFCALCEMQEKMNTTNSVRIINLSADIEKTMAKTRQVI